MRLKVPFEVPDPDRTDRRITVERIHPVVDLSTDGVSFRWPAGSPVPAIGTRYGSAWLESMEWDPIPCWLEVVRITGDEQATVRIIGCYLGVAPESATTVARALFDLQRRG